MNKAGHVLFFIGAVTLYYFFFHNLSLQELLQYGIAGLVGTLFPDILEPGGIGKIGHHGLAHSKFLAKVIFILGLGISFYLAKSNPYFYYLFFFMTGYLLHLIGDAIGGKGLPQFF